MRGARPPEDNGLSPIRSGDAPLRRSQGDIVPISTTATTGRPSLVSRLAATAALGVAVLLVVVVAVSITRSFAMGLLAFALLALGAAAVLLAVGRRGAARMALSVVGGVFVVAAVGVLVWAHLFAPLALEAVCLAVLAIAVRHAFRPVVELSSAAPPKHAVLVWNPRSGGGKAAACNLAAEAEARGIETIELRPGHDLLQLVEDAVAGGADALGAAGGDGTQALVASIAAQHKLPYACIPAGTRNHFALDLGVDRNDVVGALDAFVNGRERRVDLGEVNGRVFVNNVSLGIYGSAVQRDAYRDAKLHTLLDTVPDVVGQEPSAEHRLRWTGPDGTAHRSAAVLLVSNNPYRLGGLVAPGTRPRLDRGVLGIVSTPDPDQARPPAPILSSWQAPELTVEADAPVPMGIDGEALKMDPPLHFTIRPGALRVRIAPQHPGGSPSSGAPTGVVDGIRRLLRIAAGSTPSPEV